MGRETKILLGLLAVLAGVFLGVLAVKLLVPRPPAGAGPDIRTEVAVARPIEVVEPPALDPPAAPRRSFPAAPAAAPAATFDPAPGDATAVESSPEAPVTAIARAPIGQPSAAPARDPSIERASFTSPTAAANPAPPAGRPAVPEAVSAARSAPGSFPSPPPAFVAPATAAAVPSASVPTAAAAAPAAIAANASLHGGYFCQPGDSWWSLAEQAYGDGRLYRALFAWNRTLDPRVSLTPGTRLELPPRERLEAAWPRLLPTAAAR